MKKEFSKQAAANPQVLFQSNSLLDRPSHEQLKFDPAEGETYMVAMQQQQQQQMLQAQSSNPASQTSKPKLETGLLGEVSRREKERERLKRLGYKNLSSMPFFMPSVPNMPPGMVHPGMMYPQQGQMYPGMMMPPGQMHPGMMLPQQSQLQYQQIFNPSFGVKVPANEGDSDASDDSLIVEQREMARLQWLEIERAKERQRMVERAMEHTGLIPPMDGASHSESTKSSRSFDGMHAPIIRPKTIPTGDSSAEEDDSSDSDESSIEESSDEDNRAKKNIRGSRNRLSKNAKAVSSDEESSSSNSSSGTESASSKSSSAGGKRKTNAGRTQANNPAVGRAKGKLPMHKNLSSSGTESDGRVTDRSSTNAASGAARFGAGRSKAVPNAAQDKRKILSKVDSLKGRDSDAGSQSETSESSIDRSNARASNSMGPNPGRTGGRMLMMANAGNINPMQYYQSQPVSNMGRTSSSSHGGNPQQVYPPAQMNQAYIQQQQQQKQQQQQMWQAQSMNPASYYQYPQNPDNSHTRRK